MFYLNVFVRFVWDVLCDVVWCVVVCVCVFRLTCLCGVCGLLLDGGWRVAFFFCVCLRVCVCVRSCVCMMVVICFVVLYGLCLCVVCVFVSDLC